MQSAEVDLGCVCAFAGLAVRIASRAGNWVYEGLLGVLSAIARKALRPHRLDQRADADDVHDPRQIIGEHAQCHLGAHVLQPLHQEVGGPHPAD